MSLHVDEVLAASLPSAAATSFDAVCEVQVVAASPESPVPSRLAVPAHSEDGRVSWPAQSLPTVWDSSYLGPCARWAFFPWLLLKLSLDLFIASFQ